MFWALGQAPNPAVKNLRIVDSGLLTGYPRWPIGTGDGLLHGRLTAPPSGHLSLVAHPHHVYRCYWRHINMAAWAPGPYPVGTPLRTRPTPCPHCRPVYTGRGVIPAVLPGRPQGRRRFGYFSYKVRWLPLFILFQNPRPESCRVPTQRA